MLPFVPVVANEPVEPGAWRTVTARTQGREIVSGKRVDMALHVGVGNFEQRDQIGGVRFDLELRTAIAIGLYPADRVDHFALRTQCVEDEDGDGVRLWVRRPVQSFPIQPLHLLANISV